MKAFARALKRTAGFSLIELLVAMAIGLVVTLAVTTALIRSEGSKRSTTSVNDIDQSAAFALYVLDREIRSAGTGFSQNWSTVYGCQLNGSLSGTQILPPTIPATTSAFAGVTTATLPTRLAPMIIAKSLANTTGATPLVRGDVLMVMGGQGGVAETPLPVTPASVTASQLRVLNNLGYQANNIVLLADPGVAAGCMLQEIGPGFSSASPQLVPLAGDYYSATGANVNLTAFGAATIMAQLGTETVSPPEFELFGVGANNALYNYDLLQNGGNELPVADGVVEMRAIYGLDTGSPPNGVVDSWVDATGNYAATNLLNGSAASQKLLRQIVAVRVGFFMRTSLQERSPSGLNNPEGYVQAAGTTLTLFADAVNAGGTSLAQTRALTGTDLYYRWRAVEATVPIVNVLIAPSS